MVFIDDRKGSVELHPYVPGSIVMRLEYGDFLISGNGPDGIVDIGIERKTLPDLIGSIRSNRLVGRQVPGMVSSYFKSYLLIEGMWKSDDSSDSILAMKRGRWSSIHSGGFTYSSLWSYLTSIETMFGVSIRQSNSIVDTARTLLTLDHWWNKPWESHKSHTSVYKPSMGYVSMLPSAPSLVRKVALDLPGVGVDKSLSIDNAFNSVYDMINATVKDWKSIDGIGKSIANLIHGSIRENTHHN